MKHLARLRTATITPDVILDGIGATMIAVTATAVLWLPALLG